MHACHMWNCYSAGQACMPKGRLQGLTEKRNEIYMSSPRRGNNLEEL